MKKVKFLISILVFCAFTLVAQQKKYVSYTVKKGETMKSIAKDYDASTRDLLRLNPDVSRRPDFETVIIVPNKNYGKNIVKTEPYMNDDDLYEVQPKETIYGISKKFDVSINDLIQANPALENGLKIGMKLHIPKFNQASEKNEDESFVFHTVVKDNTIYNLTKKYQVTEAELLKLNPSLLEGLKLGMVLKIKSLKNKTEIKNVTLRPKRIDKINGK